MNSESEPRKTPYQGLIPYTEKDANFFFGRERETQLITANLFAYPLTILYGPSGVGKSSVLRAGLVYQLAQRSDLNIVYNSDWKDDPLATLRLAFNTLPGLYEIPNTNLPLDEFLAESFSRIRRRLMIVLD